jgi:hypothetical protein
MVERIDKKEFFKELENKGITLVEECVKTGLYGVSARPYINEWLRKKRSQPWTMAVAVAGVLLGLAAVIIAILAWLFPRIPA